MSLRVLLADESASIRKVFQMGLQDFGAEVKSVHNGLDVVEVAQNYQPDIIFADILLQKKNGYEVSQELAQHPQLAEVPVILMWSSFMELDHGKFENSGAQGELEKPFDVEKMRSLIKSLVPSTQTQQLSEFLKFPDNITAEFVEEEKARTESHTPKNNIPSLPPQAPQSPTAATVAAPRNTEEKAMTSTFVIQEDDDSSAFDLEDIPQPTEFEMTSEFNIKAQNEPAEFTMYAVDKPRFEPDTQEQSFSSGGDDQWEAKPLNDMSISEKATKSPDNDLDQFQSMNLGQSQKKLNLDEFLYKPDQPAEEPPPIPRNSTPRSQERTQAHDVKTGEILNVQIPNYEGQTRTMAQQISPEEAEAIIRAETRSVLNNIIRDQLPEILEKVVRGELEKILQQEMALRTGN